MTMFHEVLYLHSSYFLMYRFESNKKLSKNKKEDLKETGHLLNQSWLQNSYLRKEQLKFAQMLSYLKSKDLML